MKIPVLFSVIIPLYNKQNYIKRTIESVLNQTIKDFEILIIDDGSTDDSVNIVASITDGRVRLIRQRNRGVSAARNNGIKNATGKYVCFLDADDIWADDFLEVSNKLFNEFPDIGVACPSYQVDYGNRIIHPKWRSVSLKQDGLVTDFFEMATAPFWICNSSCIAVKKSVLMQLDRWFPENETVYEDFDLWIRLGAMCTVAHSNKVCSTYKRITERNARTEHSHKVIYSHTYMNTLSTFLKSQDLSVTQKRFVRQIIDRRMVPYIYSLLMLDMNEKARKIINNWHPTTNYRAYRMLLKCATHIPNYMIHAIQKIRYRLF